MSVVARIAYCVGVLALLIQFSAFAAPYESELLKLRTEWATVKYQTPKDKQIAEYKKLIQEAQTLNQEHPHQPEIMVWYATILSSYAASKGGLGVLPDVKKARALLEEAIQMNSRVENGFAQGVLGALYARVPSWPIAFGNKKTAREHLLTAIEIDPNGSDSNYYYGDFLVDVGEYQDAKKHLEMAQHAPIRQDHDIQDRGRKTEIAASLAKLRRLEQ